MIIRVVINNDRTSDCNASKFKNGVRTSMELHLPVTEALYGIQN